ncbi:hypothetical protein [Spirosoma oryzicola]|uniref:hypothetical protein n=1 Tax=Spirosoma oryzicola TaxID=2898794 RepID=UPI001E3FE419|nr:hypothetical protein [Spirosoma oryzicola]UHG93742.1 hypothetical protein LQ777_24790 [Spirosoma oryzicola]
MKLISKSCLVLITLLGGCTNSYYDLGLYGSRVDAQNNAVAYILKNYDSLPSDKHYKLEYTFPNPDSLAPFTKTKHALWFSKSANQLGLEIDINSGLICRWTNVTRSLLEQANKSNNSMAIIDSLGKPSQPIAYYSLMTAARK